MLSNTHTFVVGRAPPALALHCEQFIIVDPLNSNNSRKINHGRQY